MAYHILSNAGRAQSEARIDPRPLRTSRSTAHGAKVVWPLDYMNRAIYLLESSSNCNWFFKNLHIAIHYQCRMCSAFHPSVCCGQMARWIKIPIGTKVGLSPGRIVLHGDPAPPSQKGHAQPPIFRPMSIVAKRSPISATAEHLFKKIRSISGPGNRESISRPSSPSSRTWLVDAWP